MGWLCECCCIFLFFKQGKTLTGCSALVYMVYIQQAHFLCGKTIELREEEVVDRYFMCASSFVYGVLLFTLLLITQWPFSAPPLPSLRHILKSSSIIEIYFIECGSNVVAAKEKREIESVQVCLQDRRVLTIYA